MPNSELTEAFRRVLAQPANAREIEAEEEAIEELFIQPTPVTEKDIANIPKLASKGDVCQLINDIEENIKLIEYRADAEARAEKLDYLRKANVAPRCRHVMSNGYTCGCPALREQQYCRFHGQAHAPEVELPLIEDVESLQVAYMSLAQQVIAKKLDARQAKVLLQIVESASRNLAALSQD